MSPRSVNDWWLSPVTEQLYWGGSSTQLPCSTRENVSVPRAKAKRERRRNIWREKGWEQPYKRNKTKKKKEKQKKKDKKLENEAIDSNARTTIVHTLNKGKKAKNVFYNYIKVSIHFNICSKSYLTIAVTFRTSYLQSNGSKTMRSSF